MTISRAHHPARPAVLLLAVLTACALAWPATAASAAARVTASPPPGTYTQDPNNPACFVQWDNAGNPHRQCCPRGLLFNDKPQVMVCDWPQNVTIRQPPVQESVQASTKAGPGPSGESADTAQRSGPRELASSASVEIGDLITYTVGITSSNPDTTARIRFTFPSTLAWVGGQDCFWDGAGIVDCMAFPAEDGFESSAFTLAANLLDLGPQTVTAQFLDSDPPAADAVPDQELTCTTLTGDIIIC